MSVENVDSSDSYVESTIISRESLKLLDEMHIEWRGRNVVEIYDDVRIKAILMAAQEYSRCSQKNSPDELSRIKSETVQFIADVFSVVKVESNQEESNLASRFDPISGTYKVLTVASSRLKINDEIKAIGRNLEHALQAEGFQSYRLSDAFSVKI